MKTREDALRRAGKIVAKLLLDLKREQERSATYKNQLKAATKACELKNLQIQVLTQRVKKLSTVQYLEGAPSPSAVGAARVTSLDTSSVPAAMNGH